jgi:hypothetical protein
MPKFGHPFPLFRASLSKALGYVATGQCHLCARALPGFEARVVAVAGEKYDDVPVCMDCLLAGRAFFLHDREVGQIDLDGATNPFGVAMICRCQERRETGRALPSADGILPLMNAVTSTSSVTEQQAETARQSRRVLASLVGDVEVNVRASDARSAAVTLPEPAVRLLVQILDGLADRREMRVDPAEMSVAEAAEKIDVPESFITGLIERGELAFRESASGPVVSPADVQSLRSTLKQKRIDAVAELQSQAQELGLGY